MAQEITRFGGTITNPAEGGQFAFKWNGSKGMFAVSGTNFQTATVKLEHKIGDTWVSLGDDAEFTASGATIFTTAATDIRVNVDGAGSLDLAAVIDVSPVYENKA